MSLEKLCSTTTRLILTAKYIDPPYGSDDCRLIQNAGGDIALNEGSLERVKRIVGTV